MNKFIHIFFTSCVRGFHFDNNVCINFISFHYKSLTGTTRSLGFFLKIEIGIQFI